MADHSSQPSPNRTIPFPSLFVSPKFRDFTSKCVSFSGAEATRSPTSVLDTRALFSFGNNPLSYENRTQTIMSPKMPSENTSSWDMLDPKGIGLALIVGTLKDEPIDTKSLKPGKGNVLLGTQLRVKLKSPPSPPSTLCAVDFGTKIKDSKNSEISTNLFSLSEMELSEDYTCVISHGPNPRTTHIFNNCIVESYSNFLSFCHTCKKHLEQTKDIFIYRGDKAFCSCECRYQEMVLDEAENSEFHSHSNINVHS